MTPQAPFRIFLLLFATACLTRMPATARARQADITENQDSLKYYLQKQQFDIDSNAKAVTLYKSGKVYLYSWGFLYTVEGTIKILSQEAGSEAGTIILPDADDISVKEAGGITYNLENGNIVSQKVDKADITTDKINKRSKVLIFHLPSLKAGSVFRYHFTLNLYPALEIPNWTFQEEYPALYSAYEVSVPGTYTYRTITRTNVPFTNVASENDLDTTVAGCYATRRKSDGQMNAIWIRRFIPAFQKEPHMGATSPYTEQLRFALTSAYQRSAAVSWDQVSKDIFHNTVNKTISLAFRRNEFLEETAERLTSGKATDLEKARCIFAFMRDSFVRAGRTAEPMSLKTTFEKRSGSSRELNILLTALLRKAGLDGESVILATKPGEPLSGQYPNIADANYTISMVRIENKDYFLDASQKYLPFGMLQPWCYNGYSRVIGEKSYGIILTADSLNDDNIVMATVTTDTAKGYTIHLKIDERPGNVTALSERENWHGNASEAEKWIRASLNENNFHVNHISVENISNPDKPLRIHYEAEASSGKSSGIVYINPFFERLFGKNPFPAATRKYPVVLDNRYSMRYLLRLEIPEKYVVDDYPRSKELTFGNNLAHFQNIQETDTVTGIFSLRCLFERNATVFPAASYTDLSRFFEQVITTQQQQLVLKRKAE